MSDDFAIKLSSKPKPITRAAEKAIDNAGEAAGFVSREPASRRGRRPSPRTGQIHAKVMPDVQDEIAAAAAARGVTQGVIIEEAWKAYKSGK
ncbi:chromosome partitioning protein ParB [Novosphingobium sp. 9U]|uniref:chromosome partitioning protein ParB n=1 Tax=Novosphingobium sp. 9U TaxID=2653158 RepID=UPI0012F24B70|nr:chromosome partitioning protein ParB [Novosphingobium sp. 9U]VWX51036.1 Chromosome partitioning protein ParB [Novosphingobium sp. 9U]